MKSISVREILRWLLVASGLAGVAACEDDGPGSKGGAAAPSAVASAPRSSAAPRKAEPAPVRPPRDKARTEAPNPAKYGFLTDDSRQRPKAVDTAYSRFSAPPGYTRVELADDSFGGWLRHLPLAPKKTPVTSYEGDEVFPGDDGYVAGVVAIDVGSGNLQSGPDVVLRLHAEWLWATDKRDQIDYEGVTKLDMPFERWMRGERIVTHAGKVFWARAKKPDGEVSHDELRDYLDKVFNWVNSTALLSQSVQVDPSQVRPGDFLVHDGKPGEAVLIVDMARNRQTDRTVVMLVQALSPAQSIHIVSPGRKIPWFEIAPPTPLVTPHTDEFSWDNLRRLDR